MDGPSPQDSRGGDPVTTTGYCFRGLRARRPCNHEVVTLQHLQAVAAGRRHPGGPVGQYLQTSYPVILKNTKVFPECCLEPPSRRELYRVTSLENFLLGSRIGVQVVER
jgi:hypothetical protein